MKTTTAMMTTAAITTSRQNIIPAIAPPPIPTVGDKYWEMDWEKR